MLPTMPTMYGMPTVSSMIDSAADAITAMTIVAITTNRGHPFRMMVCM